MDAAKKRAKERDAERGSTANDEYDKTFKPPQKASLQQQQLPSWMIVLLILGAFAVVCTALAAVGVLILISSGITLKAKVDHAESVMDVLQSAFPNLLYYLQVLANATQSASSASIEELFSGGTATDPVPPVRYANLTAYNVRMAYRVVGPCFLSSSRMVVMIHELTASSLQWVDLMAHLGSNGYCAVAIDMLGHGNSDSAQLVSGGSVSSQADYVYAFLTEIGALQDYSRVLVIGGSGFGGAVATRLLAANAGAFDKIFLENPLPYVVYPGDENATMADITGSISLARLQFLAACELTNASDLAAVAAAGLGQNSACSASALAPLTSAYTRVFAQAVPLSVSQGFISLSTIDMRQPLSAVTTPTLLIAGGYKPPGNVAGLALNYAKLAEAARDLIGTSASLRVYGTASAAPLLTHSRLFSQHVLEFLTGQTEQCDLASIQFASIS